MASKKFSETLASQPPKKSLGQNFLVNEHIPARIARLLDASKDDQILEIGPGPGALTRHLEKLPHALLLLLEKDRHWAQVQSEQALPATNVLCQDAMGFSWESLAGSWKICGNLPYNIASPLIWDILSRCVALRKAVFMIQKEVGLRLTATPGNGNYGALSVWVQCHANPVLEFTVAPGNFRPQPKVDSAVVSFLPLPQTQWPRKPEALKKLLRLCFQNRRKQIGGIFQRANLPQLISALPSLNLAVQMRPENLDCKSFLNLADLLPQ